MSDTYDYDDEFDNGPKALRDHAKKLERQLADLQKRLDDEQAARAKAEKAAKSQSLSSILRDKGVKPGLARWLDKDEVDATPEAVDAWLKENGEFFNVEPAETEPGKESATDEPAGESNVPDGMEQAVRASQALDASGVSPSEVDVIQKIQSIPTDYSTSEDKILAEIAALGVDLG